jgi:hypothetical protein
MFNDHRGVDIAIGDRVLPISWGDGVPLWLSNTPATVIAFGRTRLHVKFDGVRYNESDRLHSVLPKTVRRLA